MRGGLLYTLRFPIVFTLVVILAVQYWARNTSTAPNMGRIDGALRPCENATKCVTSQEGVQGSQVRPLTCSGLRDDELLDRVIDVAMDLDRTANLRRDGWYASFTQQTAFWGFYADVELLVDGDKVHIRSESRLGQYDLSSNRHRVDQLHDDLEAVC